MDREMGIANQVWQLWNKKLKANWEDFFCRVGLDLRSARTPDDFVERLTTHIPAERIPFDRFGLEDLSKQCCRGIEPADPAGSLFYHVLASPRVVLRGVSPSDETYPTIADLEIVENLVYATARRTVQSLIELAGRRSLAIVVFAYEYVPAADTVHHKHADLCFSRTGISRVGNAASNYEHAARGFFPYRGGTKRVHVVPARFGAFLAVQQFGNRKTIGPSDFYSGDRKRKFWVPVHKLFDGEDCIRGLRIALTYDVRHENQKIKKVHAALQTKDHQTGWKESDMDDFPFVIREDLAHFCPEAGLMVPEVHPLVEPARTRDGRLVGFKVPPDPNLFSTALELASSGRQRSGPEFVHIRHAIVRNRQGKQDLAYLPLVSPDKFLEVLKNGKFEAANFVDWTADGYIKANCIGLGDAFKKRKRRIHSLAAYSVLAQPDFFPLVKQHDIAAWWKSSPLNEFVWRDNGIVPTPLEQQRVAANFKLKGSGFDSTDKTMTAIVGFAPRGEKRAASQVYPNRESTLSYRGSGLFAPGWDTSVDFNHDRRSPRGARHMANYGLGSPYPEDTLLCAALGGFWPGAVPDLSRSFPPGSYPTTTPLTDSEVQEWQVVVSPQREGSQVEYPALNSADFVQAVYLGKFPYGRFARISLDEFILRTEITARFYQYLESRGVLNDSRKSKERASIAITSFERVPPSESLKRSGWNGSKLDTFRIEWSEVPKDAASKKARASKESMNAAVTRVKLGPSRVTFMGRKQAAEDVSPRSDKWNVVAIE